MNHTTNYHLPQWVETDRIMMGDFNDAMASIEEGLNSNAQAAAAAQDAAESAQQEAEEKGFVIGSYTGNGPSTEDPGQLITLGFQPRILLITRGWINNNSTGNYFLAVGQSRHENQSWVYELRDTGFLVKNHGGGIITLNEIGTVYDFIAFR